MLATIVLTLSIITSKTTLSSSESCFINKVSTWLLVTTIAVRFLPSPDVKICIFLISQQFCFELCMVLGYRVCQYCLPRLFSVDCLLQIYLYALDPCLHFIYSVAVRCVSVTDHFSNPCFACTSSRLYVYMYVYTNSCSTKNH